MFKLGQPVRLKSPVEIDYLKQYEGRNLTVAYADDDYVSFVEDTKYGNRDGSWDAERFEAAIVACNAKQKVNTPAPNNTGRDKLGRYASRTKTPVVLRNGSLYNVKRKTGLQVARLLTATRDGTAIMSLHGKKFFAKKGKLSLAPQSDVDAYLNADK